MGLKPNRFNLFIFVIIAIFISACDSESEYTNQAEHESSGLIQNNVYFYLNEDVTDDERDEFISGLKELVQLSTIKKSKIGIPVATDLREVTDSGFSISLTLWFESAEDYELYQLGPEHTKMVESARPLLRGVNVYDSLIFFEN